MTHLRTYLLGVFAWLLIAAQGMAFAHTASFGDAPHDHDGITCDVAVLEDQGDIALPPSPLPTPPVLAFADTPRVFAFVSAPVMQPPARAPPPRAPPH